MVNLYFKERKEVQHMLKYIAMTIIICLTLIASSKPLPAAQGKSSATLMQEHMDKMALEKPDRYNMMINSAGGNITGCLSCHIKAEQQKKNHFNFHIPVAPDRNK
jgi:hypothetical protein